MFMRLLCFLLGRDPRPVIYKSSKKVRHQGTNIEQVVTLYFEDGSYFSFVPFGSSPNVLDLTQQVREYVRWKEQDNGVPTWLIDNASGMRYLESSLRKVHVQVTKSEPFDFEREETQYECSRCKRTHGYIGHYCKGKSMYEDKLFRVIEKESS